VLAGVTIALVTQLMLNLIGMGVAPSVGAVRLEVNLQLIAMHTEGKREASSQLRRSSLTAIAMTLIADARLCFSAPLGGFIVLYALLYSAFGVASPFLPTFSEARGFPQTKSGCYSQRARLFA
jgi:hypothetical protein